MKKIHRVLVLLLAALMALSLITTAFAEPTIDPGKKASLSIYKYDITTAGKDGAWDAESYVSTGLHDGAVTEKLSKYAIQGVEFTYLRIAEITMNNELVDGQRQVGVLYGFDSSDRSTAVLSAIGLTAADAHKTEGGVNYFTSDMLNNKLSAALTANAATTDGAAWNYDVTVYPKNQTGNPTLDKTVREAKNSTGKNTGSLTDIQKPSCDPPKTSNHQGRDFRPSLGGCPAVCRNRGGLMPAG